MRLKVLALFFISILIPTAFLSYFGLLAVRSEKHIIEENIRERHETIARIVENEVNSRLADMPNELARDKEYIEKVMLGEAAIFKDQVKILDRTGRDISGPKRRFSADRAKKDDGPVFKVTLKSAPYTIAVYERHPVLLEKLEKKKQGLFFYMVLIAFSALAILSGGIFTLRELSSEWQSAELKSEFVSHLSHDLRRPLTSIRMFSEMLKENRLPSEDKKQNYYDIITEESERLTHLANNILDFSRIERGRKTYDIKSENMSRVVTDTVSHFKTHLSERERNVKVNVEDNVPVVKVDRDAISQAIMNLLTNADKFSSREKEITVNLRTEKRSVVLDVVDQGVGISPRECKKIFDKFYRSTKKEVAETDGSGLGLTLVKYIANAHKGRVKVESKEGKGSKFSLVLPV